MHPVFVADIKGKKEFMLNDADVADRVPQAKTFSNLKAGSYAISMTPSSGYDLTNITCQTYGTIATDDKVVDIPNRTLIVNLEGDERVICLFSVI
jgi:hypothetical protein